MNHSVPLIIYVHLTAAAVALTIGVVQLARAKGTRAHKAIGWAWVVAMYCAALTSLWIPAFLQLSWIHLLSLVTLIYVPVAIVRIRRGNVRAHARTMVILCFSVLVAGIFATTASDRLLGHWLRQGTWGY